MVGARIAGGGPGAMRERRAHLLDFDGAKEAPAEVGVQRRDRRVGLRSRALRPKCKTGPVLPPAPSEVPAGAFRPRSVPNRIMREQAPTSSNPGQSEASFSPSLRL